MPRYKKRADGRYCKQIVIGYTEQGKKKTKTVYAKTIKELEAKIEELLKQKRKENFVIDDAITVEEWMLQWLRTYKANREYNTVNMYANNIKKHIIPAIGELKLSQVKPIQIQDMLNNYMGTRTGEICKLTVKQAFQQAYAEGFIERDITLGLQKIGKIPDEKRTLTREEIDMVFNTEFDKRQKIFLELLYYTGVRRGEALALSKYDVNLDKMELDIRHSLLMKNDNTSCIKEPKTKHGMRTLPIPQALQSDITEYIKTLQGNYLFTKKDGEIINRSSFRKMWGGISKRIKEKYQTEISFTPHTFRHTYATNLYHAGVDLKTAQYLMGHANVEVLLKIYTHLDDEKKSNCADIINNMFNNDRIRQSEFSQN